jgi:hypothetical protein
MFPARNATPPSKPSRLDARSSPTCDRINLDSAVDSRKKAQNAQRKTDAKILELTRQVNGFLTGFLIDLFVFVPFAAIPTGFFRLIKIRGNLWTVLIYNGISKN